ncbi:hypothetical protein KQ313_00415 [Synechococcus sp. CS-1325]|uniref:hypothetical protein n=1 Tax=Synechococcus sp. CS-1325 TaxID=2847979 RepID=UPI00223B462C|nr:hypothetical protein [Synechococcus sp. CS-1325]MCT0198156.1 hypothetical protein [Synechococcus sp. CS-1325]
MLSSLRWRDSVARQNLCRQLPERLLSIRDRLPWLVRPSLTRFATRCDGPNDLSALERHPLQLRAD